MRVRVVRFGMWILTLCFIAFIPQAEATPKIQHWSLANGARVYFVETHELPMLQIQAVFDAGSSRDPADKAGVARLATALFDEGTGELTTDDIASRFEGLGAEFGASADRDMAMVHLRSLSDSALLDPALDLYARILAAPSFPQASLDRIRAQTLIGLQKDMQSPGAIADKTFYRELYGNHPYARDTAGDEASLKTITREDLINYHKRYYVGANAWLVIVGDVSRRQAKRIAERLVGQLPAGQAATPMPLPTSPSTARVQRVNFPATQNHILIGQPGIQRGDADYFPLFVGNYILGGGGLVSRLAVEVREKKGLSYSVYSYFLPLRVPGPFMLGLQTKNTQSEQALKLAREVLADFVAKGPTAAELEAAKKYITGSFPLRLDSNAKIAENLAVIAFYGLPLTYLDDFIGHVQAVNIEQIRDAFKRRIHPDTMLTVIVGGQR
ncbi:MAG: insulinase family protein [Gammaproteobacteria bacterium]|nr:insulinase family protein [Gammaproteobacteria bacterium]